MRTKLKRGAWDETRGKRIGGGGVVYMCTDGREGIDGFERREYSGAIKYGRGLLRGAHA